MFLRADLKDERDVVFLTESGILFHNIGAEKEKMVSKWYCQIIKSKKFKRDFACFFVLYTHEIPNLMVIIL